MRVHATGALMTGDSRLYILNTGNVLDEIDRIADEAIQGKGGAR